jgi:sigma-B regulation protein RsbU (phosphoserine phosphatase)
MFQSGLLSNTKALKSFKDVLYLTNRWHMPPEIKHLLKQKKLSSVLVSIDKFSNVSQQLELIGTVIIDVASLESSQHRQLARIVEMIEMKNLSVIILDNPSEVPVKSFFLANSVNSFSLASSAKSFSIDELWARISINLAYRKKQSDNTVGPASLPTSPKNYSNKLAGQLNMVSSLVNSLGEQLSLAGMVQRDFLPSKLPDTEEVKWATSFLPAEWVSGDIYDVAKIDEQHIGFYIADAVGHSMPAALLTIFLKQALVMRHTIDNNYRILSPAEVMRNLNVKMAAQKLSGYQFATCCYCLLNTKTLQLTYARAGHPYPILIRPGEPLQQLEVRGSLLGIFEQAEYSQQTIQLRPGDKLMLYSDGAEPFLGCFDEETGFAFNEAFTKTTTMPVTEMLNQFSNIAKNQKISESEFDDVTAVALEVTQDQGI